jgi:hypothetical protein
MKKYLTPCLAVVAVIAIIFCFVFNGQKGDVQKKLDEATAAAETKAADLQKQLDDATAAAETKVNEAVEAAKQEAEAQTAELQKQLDEATAATETKVTEAVEAAKQESAAKVTELEGQIADLQKQAEEAKTEAEAKLAAAEEAKAALEAQVADLQKQLEDAAAAATAAVTEVPAVEEAAATEAPAAEAAAATEAPAVEEAAATEAPAVEEAAATEAPAVEEAAATEAPAAEEAAAGEVKVLTHAEYIAAENDTEVVIESYVQDHQAWWDGKVTVYLQSEDGAYFVYEMACTEEDAAKLVPGTKIRVKGYKGEWAGEVEIMDPTFEFVDGDPYIAEVTDVTALLAKDELKDHMNEFVAVKGATIVDYDGNGAAFAYQNPEEKTGDLYFKVDVDGQVYEFCVESYLRGKDTDVYKAVEGLKVGDVVDIEGFLYWYNGANLQATSLTVK